MFQFVAGRCVGIGARVKRLQSELGLSYRQTLIRALGEGVSLLEDRLVQGVRICRRCDTGQAVMQGELGWYCRPCWECAGWEGRR